MRPKHKLWKLTRAAEQDLEDIWRYTFARWSVTQADTYHNSLIDAFNALSAGQGQFRKISALDRIYLYCPSGSHNIFFREQETSIVIIRVLHNRMDPSRHL